MLTNHIAVFLTNHIAVFLTNRIVRKRVSLLVHFDPFLSIKERV